MVGAKLITVSPESFSFLSLGTNQWFDPQACKGKRKSNERQNLLGVLTDVR